MQQNEQAKRPMFIHIEIRPDSSYSCDTNCPNRPLFNMLIESVRQDMIVKYMEQERIMAGEAPKPVIAPPGFQVERNKKA